MKMFGPFLFKEEIFSILFSIGFLSFSVSVFFLIFVLVILLLAVTIGVIALTCDYRKSYAFYKVSI